MSALSRMVVGRLFAFAVVLGIAALFAQTSWAQKESKISSAASPLVGNWKGVLHTGAGDLPVVFHIKAGKNTGDFVTDFDSTAQGAYGIPVAKTVFTDKKLKLTADSVKGTYEATLSDDGKTLTGTWSQGTPLPLVLAKADDLPPTKETIPLAGRWEGILDTGTLKLTIVLHIARVGNGYEATLDSPDQGALGIPVDKTTVNGNKITFDVEKIKGNYTAVLSADGQKLSGTWEQGAPITLIMTRKDKADAPKRPQEPKPPFPYETQEVAYNNPVAPGVKLAGTLILPPGRTPFPCVVFITGSGAQDRDETLLGHKPFWIIADYLARRGIASLRVDDRGTAKSTGNFATATTNDFKTDALAGVAYLKTRKEIDPKKIGLIGHSEGGVIAPMVAVESPDVAYIVLLAGTGVNGKDVLMEQGRLISTAMGMPETAVESLNILRKAMLDAAASAKDDASAKIAVDKAIDTELSKLPEEQQKAIGEQLHAQAGTMTSAWFRYFLNLDPSIALKKVKCPVLALNGSKDLQVPPTQNLPPIRAALETAGNKDVTITELPGLNHLFQYTETGSPMEYAKIEETFSPDALKIIGDWIVARMLPAVK